ncbi:putative F-box protein At5g44220 [Triticum aestivum]|uniref:putative F-box protein At5g44220 n=1 Tax=Triticum aestivum TaxID=4565 RepID=UPI001D02D14D|nr:putative F-box protein At5g44220 [Triticum aestivum]
MDDNTESLPDDALAQILRRLPPRDLAVSRCVRKAWCAIVDGRRLLLHKMLPHAVRGLFFNYGDRARPRPRFFASPSSTRIDSDLSFLPSYGGSSTGLVDHCGGLLLHRDRRTLCVINPATRRWEDLPWEDDGCDAYLVFDPAESLHYQVFSVPRELEKVVLNPHDELEEDFIRWPPSIWTLDVFSSSTRQWEKRSFVREAEAPETMAIIHVMEPPDG